MAAANRVTWAGVAVNLLLSLFKLFCGLAGRSAAMVADAGHSLSDLVSDFVTLLAVRLSRLPPDSDHPYGVSHSVSHSCMHAFGTTKSSL